MPHRPASLLRRTADNIGRFTQATGSCVAWLLLVMVLIQCTVVALRYGFEIGSIALQESVSYLHACCFMLGAAYTLKVDEHVRVDIVYCRLSEQNKAWVNLMGTALFLVPLTFFIGWSSLEYVIQSWQIRETSAEPNGLSFVYLLKSLIPLFSFTLLCQAFAEIIKSLLAVQTHSNDLHP